MKKIDFAALLVFVAACSVLAARMTITSYGVPHRYPIGPLDQITFDPTGLVATVTSPRSPQPIVSNYYLGYSNSVVLDTVGGPITSLNVNATDNTTSAIDFNSIDSIIFRPSVDSTGDDDADGLSNYLELMLYHTDPEKSSTSGDGISDKWKVSHQSNGMLVADLPELSVAMAKFPQVWLVTSVDSSVSVENTVSNTSDWGNQEQSSTSTTGSQTASNEFGVSLAEQVGYSWQVGSMGAHVDFTATQQYDHTWQQEVSQEVASSRQSSYNQTLAQTQTAMKQAGKTISGGKISAMLNLQNTGSIGFTMTDPQFTLYGIQFVNGNVAETPICNLATAPELNGGSSVFSINPGATAVAGVEGGLTLAEAAYVGTFPVLKVSCTSENISYDPTLSGTPMNLADVMTNVKSATAQLIVDFDNELAGQESPLSRYVATLNKYNPANPTVAGYGPVYLGEMLTEMGLTYHFDSLGFVDVNGLKRGAANDFFSRRWITMIIHASTGGGKPSDSGVVDVGANGGPDSIVVKTGDIVYLCYSGDDDRDSVPNCVAKLYGISDTTKSKKWHDFDGDGVSNFQEIYGWVPIGGTDTIHTDPANPDCDGDGIPDGADPYPLVPHLTTASNLLFFSTLDNTMLIETIPIAPQSSSGALARPLPAFPRYYADLDSMPLRCVVVQNGIDSIRMVYDTTFKDTVSTSPLTTRSRYRFMSASLAQHVLALGPDTLTVVAQPMSGGSPKTWKISGISTLENVMGAPQASNLLPANVSNPANRWKQIDISVQRVSEQIAADPRTSGIIVFRSSGPTSDTFDLTSRNTPLGAGEKIGTQSSWVADTVLSGVTANVSYTSTNLNSGTVWNYRSVPYNVVNGNIYHYGASAGFTSAKTWEIWVSTSWDSFTCVLSNFGSETVLTMDMHYRNVNGDTGDLSTVAGGQSAFYCANGTEYPVKWVDSAQVHVHDSVWTNISMLNFTQNIQLLTINVDNLAAGGFTDPLKVFSGGVVAGQGAFSEPGRNGSATCTNVQFTNNIAVPTASSPNRVTFRSTTNTETDWGAGDWASNIGPMEFKWWFK
jgi:hypothetical protein